MEDYLIVIFRYSPFFFSFLIVFRNKNLPTPRDSITKQIQNVIKGQWNISYKRVILSNLWKMGWANGIDNGDMDHLQESIDMKTFLLGLFIWISNLHSLKRENGTDLFGYAFLCKVHFLIVIGQVPHLSEIALKWLYNISWSQSQGVHLGAFCWSIYNRVFHFPISFHFNQTQVWKTWFKDILVILEKKWGQDSRSYFGHSPDSCESLW